jgi:hypothetical protein
MLIVEARVETERSGRYLVQLCQHVDKMGRARPQLRAHAEWSEDRGLISFGWGRCMLRALPSVLTLQAEAADEDALRRVASPIGARLVGIGRRDHLTVIWTRPRSAGEQPVETPPAATADPRGDAGD